MQSLALPSSLVALRLQRRSRSMNFFRGAPRTEANALKAGDKLNSFPAYTHKLQTDDGRSVALSDFLGKKVVVAFFYPKDATPGCTKEACTFRDEYSQFKALDCEVVGISSDSVESHAAFKAQHRFPFPLLADTSSVLRTGFGIPGDLFGILPGRQTFVISKDGVCLLSFNSQLGATEHTKQALDVLKTSAKA